MATFNFETITAAEALGFDGTTDDLVFTNPTSSGKLLSVSYVTIPATLLAPAEYFIDITDFATGMTVRFGTDVTFTSGIAGYTGTVLPDGSRLTIGTGSGESVTTGAGNDALFGGGGDDTLRSGEGDDVIQGNAGDDTIHAEGGDDVVFGGKGDDSMHRGRGLGLCPG